MLQKKQKILNQVGLCKDNFNDVEVKNQPACSETVLTEGIQHATLHKTLDISSYFVSPNKKQKINDGVVSDMNDSLLEDCPNLTQILNSSMTKCELDMEQNCDNIDKHEVNVSDMFNDGFDDILSSIDI